MAEDESKPGEPRQVDDSHELSALFGLMIWVFIGAIVAWNTISGPAFLRSYWWAAVSAIVVLLLVLKLPAIDAKLKLLTLEARTGLIVFVGLPILVLLVTGIVLLHEPYRVVAIRGVFLAVVVLLPATMYYLFIVTRKDSLLNEYIAILDRLGLTRTDRLKLHCKWGDDAPYESLLGPRLRVETYLQRFEAAYGPIGVEFREEFIDTLLRGFDPAGRNVAERSMNRRSSVGFTEVFNLATAVPVIVATALIALGWLMVLPPIPPDLTSAMSDGLRSSLEPSAGAVGFAFLGAYFFALQVLFRRYVRRDLRASAYVSISIRIVLAVIGTWVVVECAQVLPVVSVEVEGETGDSERHRFRARRVSVGRVAVRAQGPEQGHIRRGGAAEPEQPVAVERSGRPHRVARKPLRGRGHREHRQYGDRRPVRPDAQHTHRARPHYRLGRPGDVVRADRAGRGGREAGVRA